MKLYRIADWSKYYEVSDSKKVEGPLTWVPVRTKTDGFGYLRITQEKDRTDLLAAWYLMLGIAAKQPKGHRGVLSRNGVPLTPEDMELLTRFPAAIFDKALKFFSDPKHGWLTSEDVRIDSDDPGANPEPSESSGPTGQDRTGQNNTPIVPKGTGKGPLQLRAEKLMRRRPDTPLTDAEARAFRKNTEAIKATTEEDWLCLERFYAAPQQETYARKDLATLINNWNGEIDRARAWCKKNPQRREPGILGTYVEPTGWQEFVDKNFEGTEYATGGRKHGCKWEQVDPFYQKYFSEKMAEGHPKSA